MLAKNNPQGTKNNHKGVENISINFAAAASNPLGQENIGRLFFRLAIPALVAQIVNLLYTMVDRMYIGHMPEVGSIALSGIGIASPLLMTVSAFAVLLGAGGAPRASRLLGAGEQSGAAAVLNTAASSSLGIGIGLSILFISILKPLLQVLGAGPNSLPFAYDYSFVYLLGTTAVMFSLGMNQFISVQGFAKAAMLTTVIGAVLNIFLDPLFIFVFKLGVAGAAWATIISQAVSAGYVITFLRSGKSFLRLRFEKPRGKVLLAILALGFSPFIMNATESLLQISFNRSLFKFGGDLAVATMSINSMISLMTILPIFGFAQGAVALISYNYGAQNIERLTASLKYLLCTNLAVGIVFTGILELWPHFFVGLFTANHQLLAATVPCLRLYVAGTSVIGLQISCQQAFIAFSQAKLSAVMALLRKIILLIPLIFILPNFIKPEIYAVYIAEPVSDIISSIVTTVAFLLFLRQEILRLRLNSAPFKTENR